MKIKNNIVLALVQSGCLNLRANTIESAHAYKVVKFRRALMKAFESLQEAEKALIGECNLEVGEKGVINGKDEDKGKFAKLRIELNNDEFDLGELKTMPFDAWHELQKENKCLCEPFVEDTLENIIWSAPEE